MGKEIRNVDAKMSRSEDRARGKRCWKLLAIKPIGLQL